MSTERADGELELNIRTQQPSYVAGESIFLEIGLHNRGPRAIKAPEYFMLPADDPNKNNLEIFVYDAGGQRISRVSHTLTGRAGYYPKIRLISPGETYSESKQIAGTFTLKQGRQKVQQRLWSLGENAEIGSANEYPVVIPGKYEVQVIYTVNQNHLISLNEAERSTIWTGRLSSNTIEILIA